MREKNAKESDEQQSAEKAKEAFDTTDFPKIYRNQKYRQEIPEPPPRKIDITRDDAADEVRRFLDVSPAYPFFNLIYQGELKNCMAKPRAPGG